MVREKMELVNEALGAPHKNKEEYLYHCPFCDHHKKKLSVNFKKGFFKCWVCEKSGKNIGYLVTKFGNRNLRQKWQEIDGQADLSSFDEIREKFESCADRSTIRVPLPKEYRSLSINDGSVGHKVAMKYLKKRKVSKADIDWWKVGYCSSGEWAGRIIFPSFDERGMCNHFVTRTYRDDLPTYREPSVNKDFVFNELMIDWNQDIVICEGLFDAMVAGPNSIPLLGSTLRKNSILFEKIVTHKPTVFMALDPDAAGKESSIIQNLLKFDVAVRKVEIKESEEDLAEMGRELFLQRKAQAREVALERKWIEDVMRRLND